jgi:CHASE2 domain-containing sensor protein
VESGQWRNLSRTQRLFLSNVGVAVVIAVIVALFHQNHWLVRLENSAMDTMMELNNGLPRMSEADSPGALQFTFIDIDEASYRGWNEPYHTPRDKLLKIIQVAAASAARLIVLDIDLSREGINRDHDQDLASYLVRYGAEAEQPPLILVRTFYNDDIRDRQWIDIRPSFLDDFELPSSVHWAQPLFRQTMWDGVVRHWHLVKFGCLNGQMLLLPATQLVAATLLAGGDTGSVTRFADLDSIHLDSCFPNSNTGGSPGILNRHKNDPISTHEAGIDQRVIYTMGWNSAAPDLVTIPAHLITESSRDLSDDLIADRVVMIGASYSESADIHRTPIGAMPGALIIANAIKSFSLYGQVREPPAWVQWTLKLTLILLAAWAFSRFTSLTAVCLAGATIIGTLVPISFYFFKFGLWLDFAIPLFAMMMSRAVAEYRNSRFRLSATNR